MNNKTTILSDETEKHFDVVIGAAMNYSEKPTILALGDSDGDSDGEFTEVRCREILDGCIAALVGTASSAQAALVAMAKKKVLREIKENNAENDLLKVGNYIGTSVPIELGIFVAMLNNIAEYAAHLTKPDMTPNIWLGGNDIREIGHSKPV